MGFNFIVSRWPGILKLLLNNTKFLSGVRQLADWPVYGNEVNNELKCSNRSVDSPSPSRSLVLGIGNLLEHFKTMFTSFTGQSASLQSAFVAHRFLRALLNIGPQ